MPDPFRLDCEIAVVTGGSTGVGYVISRSLAEAGATVIICDGDEQEGSAATSALSGFPGNVEFVQADITDEEDVAALIRYCVGMCGGVSILVNNPGFTEPLHTGAIHGPYTRSILENWNRILHSTLARLIVPTRGALAPMLAVRRGVIVNISSVAARQVGQGFESCAASEAGVEALTRAVASGYGHLGVRCNGIRVGTIGGDDGGCLSRSQDARPTFDNDFDSACMRQDASPAAANFTDVAHAVRYLASAASSRVAGVTLPVGGS